MATSQQALIDYIRANYPDVYGLMSVNAEVKNVLLLAAEHKYDQAKLQGALAKTNWWKSTIATARTWDAAAATDPVTARFLLQQTQSEITATASRLGIPIDVKRAASLALNVRRLGWTQQQVMEGLAAQFTINAKPGQGTATVDTLRSLAGNYGLVYSDQSLVDWTRRILSGKADVDGFRSELVDKAKKTYVAIADEIGPNRTVSDYADQYAQVAARLGVLANPAEFDLTDSRWRRALDTVDPATGKRLPMTFDQWERELKTNTVYGYDRTTTGRAEAGDFASQLAGKLGWAQ